MRQKLKACLAALMVFAALTAGEDIYLRYHPIMTGDYAAILILDLERLLAFMVPGYVAALMIGRKGLLWGGVAGLLAGGTFAFYNLLMIGSGYFLNKWYGLLLWGAILGAFGGLVWTLQAFVIRFTRPGEQIK